MEKGKAFFGYFGWERPETNRRVREFWAVIERKRRREGVFSIWRLSDSNLFPHSFPSSVCIQGEESKTYTFPEYSSYFRVFYMGFGGIELGGGFWVKVGETHFLVGSGEPGPHFGKCTVGGL